MCGMSNWNPRIREHKGEQEAFCGAAPPSWDLRVKSLPGCPLDVDKKVMKSWQAKMKRLRPARHLL